MIAADAGPNGVDKGTRRKGGFIVDDVGDDEIEYLLRHQLEGAGTDI